MAIRAVLLLNAEYHVKCLNSVEYVVFYSFSTKRRIPFGSSFIVTVLQSLYFSLYNGSQQVALQAVKALQKRANYELVPEVSILYIYGDLWIRMVLRCGQL